MFISKTLSAFWLLASSATAAFIVPNDDQDMTGLTVNSIPYATRVKYMRLVSRFRPLQNLNQILNIPQANEALYEQSGPCPFAAYGTIIVNHTADEIVCKGANFRTGDPT